VAYVSWAQRTPFPGGEAYSGAAVDMEGLLLTMGGTIAGGTSTTLVYLYDPTGDTWTQKTGLPATQSNQAGGSDLTIAVSIAGSVGGISSTTSLFRYDYQTNTWSSGVDKPTAASQMAFAMVNGALYINAPLSSNDSNTFGNEKYDIQADTWTTKTPAVYPYTGITKAATSLSTYVYLLGGKYYDTTLASWVNSNKTTMYDTTLDSWTSKSDMEAVHVFAMAGALGQSVFITSNDTAPYTESYSPSANTWSIAADPTVLDRSRYYAVVSGKLYLAGGTLASLVTEVLTAYSGLFFVSPLTGLPITSLNLGSVIAGQESPVAHLEIWNYKDVSVSGVQAQIDNAPSTDTDEISGGNNPFVPTNPISYGGPFNPSTKMGNVYIRVKPGIDDAPVTQTFDLRVSAS